LRYENGSERVRARLELACSSNLRAGVQSRTVLVRSIELET
jgi:hypothetical protein